MNTLNDAIQTFLNHCTHHRKLSAHTIKAYRHDLTHFRDFVFHTLRNDSLQLINRATVQDWLGTMHSVKPRTVRRRLASLKSMLASCERLGGIALNPLAGFRSEVKVGISLPRVVGRTTIKSLLKSSRWSPSESCLTDDWRIQEAALIETLFSTGIRVSELAALNLNDVDMERLALSVRGKGSREREVPIVCEAFRKILSEHMGRRQLNGLAADSPVFINRRGSRISDQSVRVILGRHASNIGTRRIPMRPFYHGHTP